MSACIVALVILGFLGIFSAKYRAWAREAFDCVARRVTLRPCRTGFNEKVKATVTSSLMKRSPRVARFTHRHFEVISWLFSVSMILSMGYTAYGLYNLATVGTCDPAHPEQCVFNPGADPNRVICPYEGLSPNASVLTVGGFRDIESASVEASPKAYFFGATWCPHCAWERPIFSEVVGRFSGHIEARSIEIDVEQPPLEMEIFKHYSQDGKIPAIVIGGKYFRVGSGESQGAEAEDDTLTAIMCRVSGNPIPECQEPEIAELLSRL